MIDAIQYMKMLSIMKCLPQGTAPLLILFFSFINIKAVNPTINLLVEYMNDIMMLYGSETWCLGANEIQI